MKIFCLSVKALLVMVGLTAASLAMAGPEERGGVFDDDGPVMVRKVGEPFVIPPPDPAGAEVPQPQGQALHDQVLADMRQRFDAAADPSTHLLSLNSARHAGFGYIVDHFNEIDRSGKGHISFNDLVHFLQGKKGPAFAS